MYAIHLSERQLQFVHAALIQAANHSRDRQMQHLTDHEAATAPQPAAFYWDQYRRWARVEKEAIDLANQVEGDRMFGPDAYRLNSAVSLDD